MKQSKCIKITGMSLTYCLTKECILMDTTSNKWLLKIINTVCLLKEINPSRQTSKQKAF